MSTTTPLSVHWSQKPSISNLLGLIKRGWVEEKYHHIYYITDEGRKAAELVGPCPPIEARHKQY